MCFSASASFAAGAVLTATGVVSLKKSKKTSEIPFASIPLFFGLQQVAEGFVWLSLTNPDFTFLDGIAAKAFIFFAQVLWPIWVPFSIYKFQKQEGIRNIVGKTLIGIGALVASIMAYYLFTNPIEAEILGHHISYNQAYLQQFGIIGGALYLAATAIPPFISTNRKMWILGGSILLAYIFTEIFFTQYVVSVWCFFAAILSAMVLWIIIAKKTDTR
ncbi:hypothetical protein QYS49_24035 [Marivirga salinae]|uniref:Uncharacterized protein n=1 Tax=Marivirga salinarum TaxID=3059078 RepID=A0AA49JGM2_9BACT|nr:DUF6629 family protein [Marivirga sp. BDSF4-3]WKK74739.2 hypothetical protein QYS49_24035 [Marivirga sp. BDSF4-3]